jgi:hypothetical protein
MRKGEVYAQVLEQARVLFEGQRNWVSFCNPVLPPSYLSYFETLRSADALRTDHAWVDMVIVPKPLSPVSLLIMVM